MSASAKMNEKDVISFFQQHGMLIEPKAVDFIINNGNISTCMEIIENLKHKPLIISFEMIEELFNKKKKVRIERKIEKENGFEIIKDVTGKLSSDGKVDGFIEMFRDRYERLQELLKKRYELKNAISIKKLRMFEEETSIIGIVRDVRSVKNGFVAELEDEEDWISVYIPKQIDYAVVNDEVIGAVGKRKGDLFIAKNIIRPELPIKKNKNFSEEDGYIVFTSDLHVGSKSFLDKKWNKFIEWLNGKAGNERQKNVAKKVKYIVISGDIVEGVGIYPKQEEDLAIEDLYLQYEEVAKKFDGLPQNIKIILQPGNHDAVRPPLPQPAFEDEIKDIFKDLNTIFIGNPCYMKINGIIILSYHGQSIQDFATTLPGLNQNKPTKIMKEMLKRRHLAPMYGGITSLAPEKEDYMVIDLIPDIFVTGHVHTTAVENYRDVILMNSSAWQSQTTYQKMMNFMPDPAKAVVVNMKNLMTSVMAF